MKDKGRDRGSQINVGEKVLPWGRDGERRGGRSPAGGGGEADGELSRGRGRCTPGETGRKPLLPAGERRSLSLVPGAGCGTIRRGRPDSGRARGWKGAAATH